MTAPIYIQNRYQSAYSLLGAMADQLATALRSAGHDVREPDPSDPPSRGTFLFFNVPPSIDTFPPALLERDSDLRAVQIFVDHPFALPAVVLDDWHARNGLENLRLCLPCADDTHLLRLRFPGLNHEWLRHAIPRDALCDADELTAPRWASRTHDAVVAGSIASEAEVSRCLSDLPPKSSTIVRAIADTMLRDPRLGFVQALDLCASDHALTTGDWATAASLWRAAIMLVNRARRVGVVRALQGIDVAVFGPDAWRAECTGTIRYLGNADYAQVNRSFADARVAIAWGPTQFAHSYSERLMLAMGAGCAPISDDRLLVRRDFNDACAIYNAANPASARAACDHLLNNPGAALELAARARASAEQNCLWEQRIAQLIEPAKAPPVPT